MAPLQVTLTATCSGANCNGVNYAWSGPNNFNATGSSVNVTAPGSNGSYPYTVTASRAGCSNQSATATVNVNGCGGGTPPGGGSCTPFGEVCSGNDQEIRNITINVATAGNYPLTITYKSHERDVDGIVRTNGSAQTVRFNQSGSYTTATTGSVYLNQGSNTIGLSSGSGGGYVCFNNICVGNGGGTPPANCDFTMSANTTNANCNQQVQLTANCSGANCDGVSYSWNVNNFNLNGQSVTITAPGSNGSFTYTVTASRSGCSTKTANAAVNVSGCGGGSGGSCTGFGEVCSGNDQEIRNITINVATAGNYPLTITYKSHERDVDGIVRTNGSAQTVRFNQSGSYTTATTGSVYLNQGSNTIGLSSGSGGGYVCFNNICVGNGGGRLGTSEPGDLRTGLVVLPNPSRGTVTIRFRLQAGEGGRLSVVTLQGRVVHQRVVQGTGVEQGEVLELNKEASGLYLLRLEGERSGMRTGKLVLER